MADQLAVGTEPADLAAGAMDEGGEARESITKKRKKNPQEVPMGTEEGTAEETAVFAAGAATVRPCSFVPDVALEAVYDQMKLGLESFSSWWKKQFPVNTYEEDIQKAFEMHGLNVKEADLTKVVEQHADCIYPFTLTGDLAVKRLEMIDAAAVANKSGSVEDITWFGMRMKDFMSCVHESIQRNLFGIGTVDSLGKYQDDLIPEDLKDLQHDIEKQYNLKLADAQTLPVNFGAEYVSASSFWRTMSPLRPSCIIIGAGAVSAGARDTPDEQAFQIENFIYYEKVKEGFDNFKSWAKDHFAPAAHPRFDDTAIQILFDMFSLELAKENAKTIEDKIEATAQLMEAQEKWRATIGVPLDFDDVRKKLLSAIKDAKMKASAANLDKRIACYLSAINKKIACFDRLIARLSTETNREEGNADADGSEEGEEIPTSEDLEQLLAMKAAEEAKKVPEAAPAYKVLLREAALKKLNAAREDLKKHLNSITRRQYLYSTIKVTLGGIDKLPEQAIRIISWKLKPHEIINFRDGANLKGKDKEILTKLAKKKWRKKRATRMALKKKVREKLHGEPLSEDARGFIFQLAFNPRELYDSFKERVEDAEEMTNKKFHLMDVRFGIDYEEGDEEEDEDPEISLCVYGLVREDIDILSTYKDNVSENCRGCFAKYYVLGGYDYYIDGFDNGFSADQEDLVKKVKGIGAWLNSPCNLPFTVSPEGEVRQVYFSTTASGRITFDFESGITYDPDLHPLPLHDF